MLRLTADEVSTLRGSSTLLINVVDVEIGKVQDVVLVPRSDPGVQSVQRIVSRKACWFICEIGSCKIFHFDYCWGWTEGEGCPAYKAAGKHVREGMICVVFRISSNERSAGGLAIPLNPSAIKSHSSFGGLNVFSVAEEPDNSRDGSLTHSARHHVLIPWCQV